MPTSHVIAAGAVGGLGVLYCLTSFARALSPPTPQEAWLLAAFPVVRIANLLVNLAGIAQNAALLYGTWLLSKRDLRGAPWTRKVALTMLGAVALWFLVCLLTFTGAGAAVRVPNSADRSSLIQGTFFFALLALVPSGLIFWLFRGARR